MLTLRFGQGTDYFAYRYIYNRLSPDGFDFSIYSTVHGEIGYLILCNLFRYAKLPYEFLLHAQQYSRCSVLLDFVNISRLILHLF